VPEIAATIIGNLVGAPDVRQTAGGKVYARFTVACQESRRDPETGEWRDGPASFARCTVWGPTAENMARANVSKGQRLIVVGKMREQVWAKDKSDPRPLDQLAADEKAYGWEVRADSVGVDLMFTAGSFVKVEQRPRQEPAAAAPPRQGGRRAAEAAY
jgi:single-strand DNA-binding protein